MPDDPAMRLTLLGTGSPVPDPARRGPSQCVEIGGRLVLVDCGSGVVHRLLEAGYDPPPIDRIAITHLHSDHILGLTDLLWTGWVMAWWQTAPRVVGPRGTAAMVRALVSVFREDLAIRLRTERRRMRALLPEVTEITDGWCLDGPGYRLRAFAVEHPPFLEAFGYRIDAGGRSITISGDTRPCDNLVAQATGTDLLVHEVYWTTGGLRREREVAHLPEALAVRRALNGYHTGSEEVGKVAARAAAQRLVLSHVLLRGGTPKDIEQDAARDYDGPVVVGSDLDVFEV